VRCEWLSHAGAGHPARPWIPARPVQRRHRRPWWPRTRRWLGGGLNAAGSTDPNTTGPVTSGPRQNTVDPNQSANTARGPPAPTTDPSQQSGLPTPTPAPGKPVPTRSSAATDGLDPVVSGTALGTIAGPTAPGRPTTSNTATGNDPNSVPGLGQFARPGATVPPFPAQQESGFVSSVHGFGQWVGLEPDPNEHNTGGGYVPAHDGIPAKVDEGEARFVDLTKPEAEVLGVLPVGRAVKGVKLGAEVAGAGVKAWQDSHPSSPPAARPTPARTPAEQPAVGSGPAAPVPPRAQTPPQASNGGSSDPAAGSGPGRVLPRPNRPSPGDGTARPAPRPAPTTAPAGRPRAGADVRPSGPAGSRPGQRVGGPRTDREPAPIGAGAPRPATGGPESPQALTTPGTRIAPARPQAPRIAEPAPARPIPNTRPAPDAAPGGQSRLPAPDPTATGPRSGAGTDVGPSVPTTPRQVGQPSSPDTNNPAAGWPGGQPDGPPTVGGGEKARGNRYQDGTLERWDAGQQRWLPIAGGDGGAAPTSAGGDPTSNSGHPRISDLDQIFQGQPGQRQRYEELSKQPTNKLSPGEVKFVRDTREQQVIKPGDLMTKAIKKQDADKLVDGTYQPDVVRGSVARAQDTDSLRTPQEMRDGLGLDDSPTIAAGGKPWSPIPENAEYAYQLTWRADRGPANMSIPYGAPKNTDAGHVESLITGPLVRQDPPFTGTGSTSGGKPEWVAKDAPLGKWGQIWRTDRAGNRDLYAEYDPNTNTWSRGR
jgi:hypothetical protein